VARSIAGGSTVQGRITVLPFRPGPNRLPFIGGMLAVVGSLLMGAGLVTPTAPAIAGGPESAHPLLVHDLLTIVDLHEPSPRPRVLSPVVRGHGTRDTERDTPRRSNPVAACPTREPITSVRAESAHLAAVPIRELIALNAPPVTPSSTRWDVRQDLVQSAATRCLHPQADHEHPRRVRSPETTTSDVSATSDDRIAEALFAFALMDGSTRTDID
jgi:hypothetical protein